jgi:hypothetical protein
MVHIVRGCPELSIASIARTLVPCILMPSPFAEKIDVCADDLVARIAVELLAVFAAKRSLVATALDSPNWQPQPLKHLRRFHFEVKIPSKPI